MSKTSALKTPTETFENSSRSPRESLALAIAERDEVEREEAAFLRARERAKEDRFRAARAVEDAEAALNRARDEARASLVDAYVDGDEGDGDRAVADAEATLDRARKRLADIKAIADELAGRERAPGYSVPSKRVEDCVRRVVASSAVVRRLTNDFASARAAYRQYHSTLRWLNAHGYVPDDLRGAAPRPSETYFADPDPAWLEAVEALRSDPDAALPS